MPFVCRYCARKCCGHAGTRAPRHGAPLNATHPGRTCIGRSTKRTSGPPTPRTPLGRKPSHPAAPRP
eukprot:7035141-Lingulodinium_polyedra.AAC.1